MAADAILNQIKQLTDERDRLRALLRQACDSLESVANAGGVAIAGRLAQIRREGGLDE